jgi:hypothetical protein
MLRLTVKQELADGKVKIGPIYPVHNFPLSVWSLMKAALGRDGTGADSVY